jgi:fluoroacetyl-CoA thioesterase
MADSAVAEAIGASFTLRQNSHRNPRLVHITKRINPLAEQSGLWRRRARSIDLLWERTAREHHLTVVFLAIGFSGICVVKDTLKPGLTRRETVTVDPKRTISFLGEDMRMYSTPNMVDDMEYACYRLLAEHLENGESSVGIQVEMQHISATPLGEDVRLDVEIEGIDGRKVIFIAEIRDAVETVGRGKHTRFVIDEEQHAQRVADKRAKF